mmetsp:Transcript_15790/g.37153  ORF Transcript_15790/g.37153 Transcript_15790/m.37153 type:complete len:95 (-) Transcript_15790:1070-1354(-)
MLWVSKQAISPMSSLAGMRWNGTAIETFVPSHAIVQFVQAEWSEMSSRYTRHPLPCLQGKSHVSNKVNTNKRLLQPMHAVRNDEVAIALQDDLQ